MTTNTESERNARRRDRWRRIHPAPLCLDCGVELPSRKSLRCPTCNDAYRLKRRAERYQRITKDTTPRPCTKCAALFTGIECPKCRAARRLKRKTPRAMENEPFECQHCHRMTPRVSWAQKYCPSCVLPVKYKQRNKKSFAASAALHADDTCDRCHEHIPYDGYARRYCATCAPIIRAEKQTATAKAAYAAKKAAGRIVTKKRPPKPKAPKPASAAPREPVVKRVPPPRPQQRATSLDVPFVTGDEATAAAGFAELMARIAGR